MRVCIILSTLLALPQPSYASTDGNSLQTGCNAAIRYWDLPDSLSSGDYVSSAMCVGLVRGVMDASIGYELSVKPRLLCIPPNTVTTSQAVRIVAKHLNDHPEKLHLPDTPLIIEALKAAFPCKEPSGKR